MALLGNAGADDGNWVILPASALDRILSVGLGYPMLFRVQNAATLEASHCGVLEFGCEEGLLDVVEATPADAVSTLDTDCEVDFATPLDYVEPPVAPAPVKVAAAPCQDCAHGGERRFAGVGIRMDGKPVEQTPPPAPAPAPGSSGKGKSASENVLRFFSGRRLPLPGAKSAKKVDGEEDKDAKRFAGQKYTL
ncbi:ubiquitin recognition factor in ER-associated degradation protein 1-like [Triticum dicoccoides]|uniref:ubiquitin recognition factor in ER-associated degradation protein 1-like n=1 Tax=Triticum dicoccoides TaxID=85692 RepID=UPI00188E0BC0|nr:ubiquitin recognition factor in ER-associated degradation protein 1-like [Triticum dicoccoides]